MKKLIIALGLFLLERIPRNKWLERVYDRLRLSKLFREDRLQYRVEMARRMGARVGEDCRLYSLRIFSEPYLVELGDHVIVSGDVVFVTHDGAIHLLGIPNVRGSYGRIKIGNNCFIGMGTIILPNVQLGDNCIVAAGSVVNQSFEAGSVIMGNPAKRVFGYDMYRVMKKNSVDTVYCEEHPYPERISDEYKRKLLEDHYRDIPLPVPRVPRPKRVKKPDESEGE